jgi:lysine-N-methylase
MAPALPARPRLAPHILARRHVVEGNELVVLHDLSNGNLVQIGAREWTLLAAADGTRDLDGILLAAAREGARALRPALTAFLEQLDAALMLDDGALDGPGPPPRPEAPAAGDPGAAERPIEPLPGFTLTCDGSGSCCRLYGSILFGPAEAARARGLFPQLLGGGDRHERVFTPEHGSGPAAVSAVSLCDGRCAYLADSGLCSIHAAAGAAAKPASCNAYPTIYVDDGESVRAAPVVECACVLASAGREGGSPLVPPGARVRGDLPEVLVVQSMPWLVHVTPDAMAPREDLVAWSRRVAAHLEAAAPDVAAVMVSLGASLSAGGLGADPARAIAEPPPIAPADVLPWIEALHRRTAKRDRESTWRSGRDLARRASRWISLAAGAILDPDALSALLAAPVAAPGSEAFYLRALLHGHQLVGGLPLSRAFVDRAVRILVARVMPLVFAAEPPGDLDPSCAHPLALVEAMMRGHGLAAYAFDVG